MTQSQCLIGNQGRTDYWMRSVWFAGLHTILKAVAGFPHGLRAGELNRLVAENKIFLTRRSSPPAPTTLYHYRNTLLRLGALERNGRMLRVNADDPDVYKLLSQPTPHTADQSLCEGAIDPFAELVLRNPQCRSLFFDLFLPQESGPVSVAAFRQSGSSVNWIRRNSVGAKQVIFQNDTTGRTATCTSPASIAAVLYGLRYWARDELKLIDEYSQRSDGSTVMFPVSLSVATGADIDSAVLQTVRHILSLRGSGEWTLLAVSDLIARCCEENRLPIRVLFRAIDWMLSAWPNHSVPIATSRALATLTATSAQRDTLALRRFYKTLNGPYVSHIRIHKDIATAPREAIDHGPRHP